MLIYLAVAIHLECRMLVVKHLLVQYSLTIYLFLFISTLLFVLLSGSRTYSLPSVSFAGMEKKTFSCIFVLFHWKTISGDVCCIDMTLYVFASTKRHSTNFCPTSHHSSLQSFCSNTVAVISFDIICTVSHFQQQSLTVWLFADEQFLTTRVV